MWTRWNDFDRSFAVMEDFRRRVDRLFEEMERGGQVGNFTQFPRTNLYDTEAAYLVQCEVPGLSEKDIELSLHQDVLTIAGERKTDVPEGYSVHRQERLPFKFSRSFTLPTQVDAEHVAATVQDGILTVTLPKTPEAKPRQINIQAS